MNDAPKEYPIGTGLKDRLLKGTGAQAFGQGVQIFIRLAEVPLLLAFWGTQLYGEWLMLAAIPVYLSIGHGGDRRPCGPGRSGSGRCHCRLGRRENTQIDKIDISQSSQRTQRSLRGKALIVICYLLFVKISQISDLGQSLTEPTEITEKNRGLRLFGQDLQDRQDIFAFPACPAESGEERQKETSLFEGIHLTFAVGELHSVSFIWKLTEKKSNKSC